MEHKKFRSKTHPCIRSHFCSEKSHPLKYFSTGNWFSQSMGQGISHKRRQWWPIAEVKITHYYLFFWPSQWVSIKWFNTLHREKKVVISGIYLSTRAERERPKWGYFGGGWQMISSQDSSTQLRGKMGTAKALEYNGILNLWRQSSCLNK